MVFFFMETVIYGIINFFIYLIHWSDPSVQASISPRGQRKGGGGGLRRAREPDSAGRSSFLCELLGAQGEYEACPRDSSAVPAASF